MADTITVDVSFGSDPATSFSYTTENVDKAQEELGHAGVFRMMRKAKERAKKRGVVVKPEDWLTLKIVEKVNGGGVANGGKHSDATFNTSVPKDYKDEILKFFTNVDIE